MDAIALLLASLKEYHRDFVIKMIDIIVEEVMRGMERNDFKET